MSRFDHIKHLRHALLLSALMPLCMPAAWAADDAPAPAAPKQTRKGAKAAPREANDSIVVLAHRTSRSAVSISGAEIQKLLPGINPLKALETLPGVVYQTADPWGNNEQNISLFIHGFNAQQLGYTLDGVPLGDQNYGNYNGLSPQRAVISENVGQVTLSSGAGDLATPSTSNLGGTIETFSSDPKHRFGGTIAQTFGSYSTYRTFARIDTGDFGNGNSAYVSFARQDARAWNFNAAQGGYQVNAKFVHDAAKDRVVAYFDWSDKVEPNEDSVVHTATGGPVPYFRAFLYPNFNAALNYLGPTGATPPAAGPNFSNYHSAAQRRDYLGYVKWTHRFNDRLSWSNQVYYHNHDGAGIVAGPISAAGLPALFNVYFPGQNLRQIFGGSGYATRTTEYSINRGGYLTTVNWTAGRNTIQVGGWLEQNNSSQYRRWYPLFVNNPSTPYQRPANPLITQYGSEIDTTLLQTHIDDRIQVTKDIVATAGFKSSMQFANGNVPVQPRAGSLAGSTGLPVGRLNTTEAFLPEFGLTWNVSKGEQLFANIQRNARQFQTYGAGGIAPWSLGSQQAFDLFKQTG